MSAKTWLSSSVIVFLVLATTPLIAQDAAETKKIPPGIYDSAYIADYTQVLTTRLFLLFQDASLLINPANGQIPKIVYRPNVNVRIGIAGFWKWFGLGLSIDNPFYKTNRDAYGKTTTLDLRANAFGRFFAAELFFQQYKSFYISTPERPDGSHYILPDMKTLSIGVSGYWIYNSERFSIRAAFIQNERQKKSAGSFMLRPAFLYYRISSDHGIIPEEMADMYHIPSVNLITKGEFYSLGISPGYAYTFVFLKNFYLTAAVFPGVAFQYYSYSNTKYIYSDFELAFQLSGRFALGYNSNKWFLGGSFQTGFNEIPDKLSNTLFNYNLAQYRVWGGLRFDVFKKKKKNSI